MLSRRGYIVASVLTSALAIAHIASAANVVHRVRCGDGTLVDDPIASCDVDTTRNGRCEFSLHILRGGTPVDVPLRVHAGQRKTYRYFERFQRYRYILICHR